jgi:hypothetical protein
MRSVPLYAETVASQALEQVRKMARSDTRTRLLMSPPGWWPLLFRPPCCGSPVLAGAARCQNRSSTISSLLAHSALARSGSSV